MKFRQIGNGGAFNYKMVNSSFVIENNDEYLLFDCGHSVYGELRRLHEDINENFDITKLNSIFISHLDDDHIGSLKTLIYYQYFINNIKLDIYCGNEVVYENLLTYLEDIDGYVIDGKKVNKALYSVTELDKRGDWLSSGLQVFVTDTYHFKEGNGLVIVNHIKETNRMCKHGLFISGDTKASETINTIISNMDNMYPKYKIFHDFSNWNEESKQVHACKADTERIYKNKCDNITWYHNDKEFNNKWQIL